VKPALCLGTVQFGLDYGVTNKTGKLSESAVLRILESALNHNISFVDTAQCYGNAESVVGRCCPVPHDFKFISKMAPHAKASFSEEDIFLLEKDFFQTLSNLCVKSIDSFLLHSPLDLHKIGSPLLEEWLISLRTRGLVHRLGLSIYTISDLHGINTSLLDLVQLPLSLYDQRLVQNGTISYLRSLGVAIHARSVYLQGLLLTPSQKWPKWIDPDVIAHHQALEIFASQKRCQLIDLALGFAREQDYLEAVVFGVCSVDELLALFNAWSAPSPWIGDQWCNWAIEDSAILDPRLWPS